MLGTTYERSGQTKQMVSLQEGEINLKYYDTTNHELDSAGVQVIVGVDTR